MIKLKAFIYRFSAVFGLRVYLAQKEEDAYVNSLGEDSDFTSSGFWQAKHGFTTVWTYRQPFFKALIAKIKHAFTFRSYND
jgi:hypothetical protein